MYINKRDMRRKNLRNSFLYILRILKTFFGTSLPLTRSFFVIVSPSSNAERGFDVSSRTSVVIAHYFRVGMRPLKSSKGSTRGIFLTTKQLETT